MKSLLIILISLICFTTAQNTADVTGKWLVKNVDVSGIKVKLSAQQKAMLSKSLIEPLSNAVFDFKKDHHFSLSANLTNMPRDDYWEYNSINGVITIKEYSKPQSVVMKIRVTQIGGNTFFSLQESPVVLKVEKVHE